MFSGFAEALERCRRDRRGARWSECCATAWLQVQSVGGAKVGDKSLIDAYAPALAAFWLRPRRARPSPPRWTRSPPPRTRGRDSTIGLVRQDQPRQPARRALARRARPRGDVLRHHPMRLRRGGESEARGGVRPVIAKSEAKQSIGADDASGGVGLLRRYAPRNDERKCATFSCASSLDQKLEFAALSQANKIIFGIASVRPTFTQDDPPRGGLLACCCGWSGMVGRADAPFSATLRARGAFALPRDAARVGARVAPQRNQTVRPPSTSSTTPVTNSASSEAR